MKLVKTHLVVSALLLGLSISTVPALGDPYLPTVDDSVPVPVRDVCALDDQTVAQVEACWNGNGSSSKQFGSEGGSDSADSSGEGESK